VGIPGHPVEGVSLANLRLDYVGGGTRSQSQTDVPEHVAKYPSADMFGVYPACGLYCRHARDVQLSDIHVKCATPDLRPAVVCEDVSGLVLDALEARQAVGGEAILSFRTVVDALIRGCAPPTGTQSYLRVSGPENSGVSLIGNDFSRVKRLVELAQGATAGSVVEVGNRK
jgi:hypothetical protein